MSFDDTKKLVSVYNEAQMQIDRLDEIWRNCHRYVRAGNLISYKWELDRAWIELSEDARKINDKYKNLVEKYNEAISKCNNSNQLYQLLQKKEIFLKGLQEASGKGSKRKQEGGTWF